MISVVYLIVVSHVFTANIHPVLDSAKDGRSRMIEPIVGLILLMLSQSRPSSQSKVYSHYGRSSVGIFSGLG